MDENENMNMEEPQTINFYENAIYKIIGYPEDSVTEEEIYN